jgi:hypothetical protein
MLQTQVLARGVEVAAEANDVAAQHATYLALGEVVLVT